MQKAWVWVMGDLCSRSHNTTDCVGRPDVVGSPVGQYLSRCPVLLKALVWLGSVTGR